MNRSRIPWLVNSDGSPGYTWSPTSGCGPGLPCYERCWARAYHVRYRGGDFSVKLHPSQLDAPLRLRRPSTIGVCLMGDLFHEDVPEDFILAVFGIMAAAERHCFILLTKRPERVGRVLDGEPEYTKLAEEFCGVHDESEPMFRALNRGYFRSLPLPNVWLGVSVEDQATADERIPVLLDTPAAHRFVSLEPQIEPVDLGPHLHPVVHCDLPDPTTCDERETPWCSTTCAHARGAGLDLVIQGCESGPRRRPFDDAWAYSVKRQCEAAGVAWYFKQTQIRQCEAGMSCSHDSAGGCHDMDRCVGKVVELPLLDGHRCGPSCLPWSHQAEVRG